jgi:flagellar motor protein MotB
MNRFSRLMAGVGLVIATLATAGCQDQAQQNELKTLRQGNLDLTAKNNELQKQLAAVEGERDTLANKLDKRDQELLATKSEMDKLKKGQPTGTGVTAPPPIRPPGDWQTTATGAKISLASDILFAPGKAELSAAGVAKIKEVAGDIKTHYADHMVRVYGFTDADPIVKSAKLWQDNLELSANRAMEVTREMTKLGLTAGNVETIAMGQTHLIAGDKAKSRRVEIVVIKGTDAAAGTSGGGEASPRKPNLKAPPAPVDHTSRTTGAPVNDLLPR